ncbi:MAG TPA: AAA family ATPase, partial [Kofleriaceae bacterium]|nr:AAA family ATPase [Kofleriaceae bacterium]
MRILAIRGCNLASLAGEFEVDLSKGALAEAGVFAIVGPTGAGKSTLLDAMCVALFDRTPRLANRSTVVVGRGDDDPTALGAQDVRSLLRRGASAGWAEVDFESGDLRRYRARWSVRRARGSTEGRFQNQQVTLTAIDPEGRSESALHLGGGDQLGGTKTETLAAIQHRLGLSFDQFRRSALLAQGEFAAFLRADGKDRSELLERMTGTEIYSRLSVAAHQKATLAVQQLRDRQGVMAAIPVLSDEARMQAEADLVLAKQAQEASRVRLAAAQAAARWLTEADRRQRAVAEAETEHAARDLAVKSAEVLRAEHAVRRRAESMRPAWDAAAAIDRQVAIANGELATAATTLASAETAQRDSAARHTRLSELHAPIREARVAAGLVEKKVAKKTPRTRDAAADAKADANAGARTDARADAARAARDPQLEARALAAASDAEWLASRHELASAIAAWRELDGKLGAVATLATEIAACDRALDDHARKRDVLAAQHGAATTEHQQAIARLADARREAASYQQKRGLSLEAARRQEDEARRRSAELDKLVAITGEARGAATARAELERQLAQLAATANADGEHRRTAEADRDAAALLRDERARHVEELRKAAGYAHARAELVDGDPCPLCGAEEHPWADRGSFDALIVDAQTRLAEAIARGDAARSILATLAAREQHRATERTRLTSCLNTADATAQAAHARWRTQLASLGELLLVDDPSTPAAQQLADERIEGARTKLEAARAARSHAEAAANAANEAQARVQARHADVEHHALRLRELEASLGQLDAASERVRGERTGKLERDAELRAQIAASLALWTSSGLAQSETTLIAGTLTALKRTFADAAPDADARADARANVLDLQPCRQLLSTIAAEWAKRADAIIEIDALLAAALIASEELVHEHERDVVAAQARVTACTTRREALRIELAEAADRLEAARVTAGFAREELQRLLSADAARVDELAAQLAALDRAADRARTLVIERRRLVEDHEASRPNFADPAVQARALEDAQDPASLKTLAAAVDAADGHAASLAASLAADADARARRAAAAAELAAAEQAAEVDRVLGEVIGSHDGKAFRSFAQSLTLDALLAVANSHLEELAPRYQLERVPKHDLELQVIDRDLGDEIRSVQSLSGGESFLVSLALALGLSSMSAHDVRVRTLLIDEGFGTLDPATLDTALAVLDELQSTGRQVGVISHVPALVER